MTNNPKTINWPPSTTGGPVIHVNPTIISPAVTPPLMRTDEQISYGPFPNVEKPSVNPKDALGAKKVSITKFPATALLHGAHAMMNGATKYGPYNWRSNPVLASIYIDACFRHLMSWFEGEQVASDSGVHHLGHALACIAILLDAEETGNLVDDRPIENNRSAFVKELCRLNDLITAAWKEHEAESKS